MLNITDLGRIIHVDDEEMVHAVTRRLLDIPKEKYLTALSLDGFLQVLERLSETHENVALIITDFSYQDGFDGFDAVSVVEALQKTAKLPEHLQAMERIARIKSAILERTKIVMLSGNFEPPDSWTGSSRAKMGKARARQREVEQNSPGLLTIVSKPFDADELRTVIRRSLGLQESGLQEPGQ